MKKLIFFLISIPLTAQINIIPVINSGLKYQLSVNTTFNTTASIVWGLANITCPSAGTITQTGILSPPQVTTSCTIRVTAGINSTSPIALQAIVTVVPGISGSAGIPGPQGIPGPPGPPGTGGSSNFIYQEIPTSDRPSSPALYGTGFSLNTKCKIIPATLHLYSGGVLYYRDVDYYVGTYTSNLGGLVTTINLLPNQIAALNFSLDTSPNCGVGNPCEQVRVDYQYIPDQSGNCP